MKRKHEDNTTFIKRLMTYSKSGPLMQIFIINALDFTSRETLNQPDMNTGFVNREAWMACAQEIQDELIKRCTL